MLANKLLGAAKAAAPATYIEDVFSTYLYTGNGAGKTISNGIAIGTDYPYGWSELHLTGDTLTDTSRFSRTVTANAVTVSTTTKKFGTGSLEFNGSTYLTAGKAFLNDAFDSWELQCWVYWNSTGTSSDMGMICSQYAGSTSGRMLFGSQSGDLVYRVNGATVYLTTTVTTGQWYHIVLNWDGTTHRLFKDGVLVSSSTTAPDVQTSQITEIGGNSDLAAYDLDGYIDDLTITNNQPVYTADFTVPTSASLLDTVGAAGSGGLVWLKGRSGATDHALYDTARGATFDLVSNLTDAATTQSTGLTAFNSNGFSLGALAKLNTNAATYTSWTFRKQAKFFDVVTYTGNGTAGRTVAHNLGSVPGCIIVKRTNANGSWQVYHRSLANTQYLVLNSSSAAATDTTRWNNTTPTSTEFSLGTDLTVNGNGSSYVAYLFAHDAGGFGSAGTDNVITCGSYTGNGSATGPTITLGYEPQWILIKRSVGGTGGWVLHDTMRGLGTGGNSAYLQANVTDAEVSSANLVDVNATGFQLKTTGVSWNANGSTYIYIAIRRGPMKTPTSGTTVYSPVARTGTGAAASITSVPFPPDWVMFGPRSIADNKYEIDRLRGASEGLITNSTSAGIALGSLLTLNMNGISFSDGNSAWNQNAATYVNWFFGRAPGFFDVVCYTGTGANRTVTHNLGVAPEFMIVKDRSNARAWCVYSSALGNTKLLLLNDIDAPFTDATAWNNTTPTSSVFTVGTLALVNFSSETYVAYLFATVAGVSKVGSYTGTGTTQVINCGFTAGSRFVMIKRTDLAGDWYVWDSARGIVAGNDPYLLMNSSGAEVTNTDYVDTANSGFEISSTAPAAINANGGSFIFFAVA
jgi:hypothetical protein